MLSTPLLSKSPKILVAHYRIGPRGAVPSVLPSGTNEGLAGRYYQLISIQKLGQRKLYMIATTLQPENGKTVYSTAFFDPLTV